MTFPEFLHAFTTGTLEDDAAWRAYDIIPFMKRIGGHQRIGYVRGALKRLGMAYAGELALPEFCARYGVDLAEAPTLLGAWWLWSGIDAGRRMGVPLRPTGGG